MSIKTIIIDDEPLGCMLLQDMLSSHTNIEVVAMCHDGFEGLEQIQRHRPDLIFVDIQMPGMTGVEMIELIETKPLIVFSTAYDQYAVKAFEMNAVDYLLKPYDNNRIDQTIQKINGRISQQQPHSDIQLSTPESAERIVVKENGVIKMIPTHKILYIEAAGDYVKIYTEDKLHIKHGKISHFENVLANIPFVRIHRSYLMNFNFLSAIGTASSNNVAVLKNNTQLPISKSGNDLLKALLNKYN